MLNQNNLYSSPKTRCAISVADTALVEGSLLMKDFVTPFLKFLCAIPINAALR